MAWHLKLESQKQKRIERGFEFAILGAALTTIPLTAAYWFEWDGAWVTVGDWAVWTVFLLEYLFFLLVSPDRVKMTRERWLSVAIIFASFPMWHELFRTTRLIRLARLVPLLRTSTVLRQIQLFRLASARSAGSQVGWKKAQRYLDDDHVIIRCGNWCRRLKQRIIQRITSALPGTGD